MTLLGVVAAGDGPPLDPSGDQARSLLRDELAKPDYLRSDIVDRILRWLERLVNHTTGAVSRVPLLTTLAAIVVIVALLATVLLLGSRARRTAGSVGPRAALTDRTTTAAELRDRAEAHLAAGRYDAALVDGFRALARGQIERGIIEDVAQATAHELARAIAASGAVSAGVGGEVAVAADLFDAVLYGDHPATRDQAVGALALAQRLAGRSVVR